MKKAVPIARVLLGLVFTVFGLNGFLNFIPMPDMPEPAMAFMGGLAGSGYLLPLLKLSEVACGVLLLVGRYVPLALTILAPITINILAFHIFLDMNGLPMAVVIIALQLFLAWSYRSSYQGVLQANAAPTS